MVNILHGKSRIQCLKKSAPSNNCGLRLSTTTTLESIPAIFTYATPNELRVCPDIDFNLGPAVSIAN